MLVCHHPLEAHHDIHDVDGGDQYDDVANGSGDDAVEETAQSTNTMQQDNTDTYHP